LFERFGGDYRLVNVVAFGALKDPEVETYACGHDASEHHVSAAPWAGGALDSNADVVGQRMRFWHKASFK
jgi:hypothetical protein